MFRIRSMLPMLATTLALACTSLEPTPTSSSEPLPPPDPVASPTPTPGPSTTPTRAAQRSGPIEAEWLPQFGAIPEGRAGTLNLLIRLRGQGQVGERPPLELAIVLDRSGSMTGDKIRAVKQAAVEMIGQLDPADEVTLVSYSTDVLLHGRRSVDGPGARWLRSELLGLEDGGGTALGPALFRALGELAGTKRNPEALSHVLLLSDGLANEGESDPNVIAARAGGSFLDGISTSTLGVGLDYNEDLMTKVADAGGGRYHFIESEAAVRTVLADELAGLTSTVARNIELDISPTFGLQVDEVHGYPVTEQGNHTIARVGALAAEQSRAIVIRMQYPASKGPQLALGEIGVRFVDAATGDIGERLVLEPVVDVVATAAEAQATEDVSVTVRVAELEAAAQLRAATSAMERRDFEGAKDTLRQAIDGLEAKQAAMPEPSPELDAQIEELEQAVQGVDKAKDSRQSYEHHKKAFKSKAYKRSKK